MTIRERIYKAYFDWSAAPFRKHDKLFAICRQVNMDAYKAGVSLEELNEISNRATVDGIKARA